MTSNTDSTLFVYLKEHIRVKGYLVGAPQLTVSPWVRGCTVWIQRRKSRGSFARNWQSVITSRRNTLKPGEPARTSCVENKPVGGKSMYPGDPRRPVRPIGFLSG